MYDRKKICSAQNLTDVSFFCSVSNHAYKNSEKNQILFIDKLDHKPTIHRISRNTPQKVLHRIDLQEQRGELCIDIQRERRSHLANHYGLEGLWSYTDTSSERLWCWRRVQVSWVLFVEKITFPKVSFRLDSVWYSFSAKHWNRQKNSNSGLGLRLIG